MNLRWLRFIKGRVLGATCLYGPYTDWSSAKEISIGYDSKVLLDEIVKRSKDARDRGLFERDAFILNKPRYDFSLLALIADLADKKAKLRIVDFGGGCGTTYFNNQRFLGKYQEKLEWIVVEQAHLVDQARNLFAPVKFESSFSRACESGPDIIIFSGSLQYIEDLKRVLAVTNSSQAPYCLIDRIPFLQEDDRPMLIFQQQVGKKLGGVSYPLWVTSQKLLESNLKNYELIDSERSNLDSVFCKSHNITFHHLIFKLRGHLC